MYANSEKISNGVLYYLQQNNVEVYEYSEIDVKVADIANKTKNKNISVNDSHCSAYFTNLLAETGFNLIDAPSPIARLKAVKNPV